MRRLLIATTLGLGLASTGGIAVSASPSPIGNHRPSAAMPVQSIHYDDRARRFEPWHHWHRPVPHRYQQPYQGWHRGYEYSRR
jgi:hypothetical protein